VCGAAAILRWYAPFMLTYLLLAACNGGSVSIDAQDAEEADTDTDSDADADADADADSDTDSDSDADPVAPVQFSVMGDIPYGEDEIPVLDGYVEQHNASSASAFLVHVGDIKSQGDPCDAQVYDSVAAQLRKLDVPVFVLVGDNEWNDCPDPDEAWALWSAAFVGFYGNFEGVETQEGRRENFAFVRSRTLFIGFTMTGGAVHSEEEWADFQADASLWVGGQLTQHGSDVDAMVLFMHAKPRSDHDPFIDALVPAVAAFDRPVLLVHGDGHSWIEDKPYEDAPTLTRIQVEAGGDAPPLQVTVDVALEPLWQLEREPF
jgi:hypothetical protein